MSNDIITTKINKIVLKNLNGEEISLMSVFLSFNIYESIFSKFKTGEIHIADTKDLAYNFPIVGGEELTVHFTSANDAENQKVKIQTFVIYKIGADYNAHVADTSNRVLPLFFCSPELILSEKINISKRISNTSIDIISDMLINLLGSSKPLIYDTTDNIVNFISNFWTCSKIINYLELFAENTFNDFIFFENMNGFNFRSITEMLLDDSTHDVTFIDNLDVLYKYNSVKGMTTEKYFDDLEFLITGGYGNTFYQLYRDQYGFSKYENDFGTITDHSASLGKNVQHRTDMINNNNILWTMKSGDILSKKALIKKGLDKYKVVINMNGDSTKTVGQVINFSINDRAKEKEEYNELMTGKWLITKINHELSRDGKYSQNIEIVKNAFNYYKDFTKITGRKNI